MITAIPPKPSKVVTEVKTKLIEADLPVFNHSIRRYSAFQKAAMAGLPSGEIKALSTGLSEAVAPAQPRQVRIPGVTADARVDAFADAPTMKEQGLDTTFVNWRGFFAAPGIPDAQLAAFQDALTKMYDTPEWEEVRARNGWVNIHNNGDEFRTFLEDQEKVIGDLMKTLGFL